MFGTIADRVLYLHMLPTVSTIYSTRLKSFLFNSNFNLPVCPTALLVDMYPTEYQLLCSCFQ